MAIVKFHHIRDPVHGFISIPEKGTISDLIDTPEFQRLRYIRQLGVSYNVYPGAEHTRFFHSLGVSHLAGETHGFLTAERLQRTKKKQKEEKAESFNAEREKLQIAALLHDVGHAPFSHVLEKFVTPDVSHEMWGQRIIESGETAIGEIIRNSSFKPEEISKLISKKPSNPRYLHLIVSSQMDADRFDYLLRDSYYTGNLHGTFDLERILRTIGLSHDDHIMVKDKGKHSVEGYIISRYHMYNQVYEHQTTLCFQFLLKSILKRAVEVHNRDESSGVPSMGDLPICTSEKVSPAQFLSLTDDEILAHIRRWTKSDDRILSDLSKRYIGRSRIFKPVKLKSGAKIEAQSLVDEKDKIEDFLRRRHFDPQYYLEIQMGGSKGAYQPYSPAKYDQENAILLENGQEISTELKSIGALEMRSTNLVCVPEECRHGVAKMLE